MMELSELHCAMYGQGRLVPTDEQARRMQELGLELRRGLTCPNETYANGFKEDQSLRRVPPRRADWDEVKADVMLHICRHKFGVAPDAPSKAPEASASFDALIASGEMWVLVEHPRPGGDSTWGDGGDGTGRNWLGKCLTQLLLEKAGAPQARRLTSFEHLRMPNHALVDYT